MITKNGKKSIYGIMAALILITSCPIRSHALAAGATYTAYEIISMIFAVVGGTTIQQTQGLVGGSSFDASALYETMNTQSAGMGSLLSSYVNRAQYLAPGSDLVMSDADYQAFLEYFKEYNLQNSISGEITSESEQSFISNLEAFYGITLPNTLPYDMKQKINGGIYLYAMKAENAGTTLFPTGVTGYYIVPTYEQTQYQDLWYNIKFSQNYYAYSGGQWVSANAQGVLNVQTLNDLTVMRILGGIGYKSNTIANEKIKNGTYDTVSKSRTWDATQGKLVGHTTITMPATETLDEAVNKENVKDITDAVNVYPVDTSDDSMIYYPTQSAADFIIPEMTVQTNVYVKFPAIDGDAGAYTMDLTSFFPFCIPFDIYAFLQAFEAEPEAPSITYNFPYINASGNVAYIQQTFDLSQFDGVAQLVRRLELVAFIIGLAFVTRSFFLRG